MYMLLVLQSGCHKRWSSNEVTSSPRKFQTATVRFLNVRNSWFSYRKINADGVINSVLLTSFNSELRTCKDITSRFICKENSLFQDKEKDSYVKNLEILVFLLDKKLFIELFNEIHLLIPMKQMVERFENSTILYWKNLKRNMATSFGEN